MFESLPLFLAQDAPAPHLPGGSGPPSVSTGDSATTAADGAAGAGAGSSTAPPPGGSTMWIFLLLILVVMWVFMIGGGRKEKKKKAAMLATMAKGDKVQTVGGILGTVVEVRGDDEVVVKVDENSNARLRFARSAIQTVFKDEEA